MRSSMRAGHPWGPPGEQETARTMRATSVTAAAANVRTSVLVPAFRQLRAPARLRGSAAAAAARALGAGAQQAVEAEQGEEHAEADDSLDDIAHELNSPAKPMNASES